MSLIEDAGELIPGAKKALSKPRLQAYQPEPAPTAPGTTLRKLWPEPKWQRLHRDGLDKTTLARLYGLYYAIAPKPITHGRWSIKGIRITPEMWNDGYAQSVTFLRDGAEQCVSVDCVDALLSAYKEQFQHSTLQLYAAGRYTQKSLRSILSPGGKEAQYPRLLPHLNFPMRVNPKKITLFPIEFTHTETGERSFKLCELKRSGCSWYNETDHYTNDFDRYETAVAALQQFHYQDFETDAPSEAPPPYIPKKQTRHLLQRQRTLPDIAPDQLLQDFGFRGVQFGNYLPQTERRLFLSHTHDALVSLADILAVPKHWLGGGKLGIAFGARGHGFTAAHYELTLHVVNLTRFNGPGSIAHELCHSLDARMAQRWFAVDDLLSERLASGHLPRRQIPREHRTRFQAFQSLLDQCLALEDFVRCARNIGSQKRAAKYWTKPCELFARAFEAYIQDAAEARGIESQWLASGTKESDYDTTSQHPYPCGRERETMNQCFDENLKTLFGRNETPCTKSSR